MAKRARTRPHPPTVQGGAAAVGASGIGPRQPCPCGSGRRYKACHGAAGGETPYVVRTFAGLPGECDWVALREFIQCGTAPLTLRTGAFGSDAHPDVLVSSVLPGIAPALRRQDGDVWLAVQVAHQSGDVSTDIATALSLALDSEPGVSVSMPDLAGAGVRLQDVVDPDAAFTVTVRDAYDYWFDGVDDPDGSIGAMVEQINDSIEPAARLEAVDAAYWSQSTPREFLRWVLPHDEDRALDALARLHAAEADGVVEGSRLVGSFRAHGLLVPVWDLPPGTGSDALEEPLTALAGRLGEALSTDSPLTSQERAARNGLASRQLTIR